MAFDALPEDREKVLSHGEAMTTRAMDNETRFILQQMLVGEQDGGLILAPVREVKAEKDKKRREDELRRWLMMMMMLDYKMLEREVVLRLLVLSEELDHQINIIDATLQGNDPLRDAAVTQRDELAHITRDIQEIQNTEADPEDKISAMQRIKTKVEKKEENFSKLKKNVRARSDLKAEYDKEAHIRPSTEELAREAEELERQRAFHKQMYETQPEPEAEPDPEPEADEG